LRHRPGRRALVHRIRDERLPPEAQTAKVFERPEYRFLIVANKFQTGFDQPLFHTIYVDKKLGGVNAVQTLSRLNRTHTEKKGTTVVHFANELDEIKAALVQAVRASLAKRAPGEAKIEEELDHAVRQIVSRAVVSEGSSTSSPPPVFRRVDLFGHLKFDPPSVRDAFRRVEDLDGNQVSPLVVVEYDARLVLVALG